MSKDKTPSLRFMSCPCAACLVMACDMKHGCNCIRPSRADKLKFKVGGIEHLIFKKKKQLKNKRRGK